MKPIIQTFRSSETPWEIFQKVHSSSAKCFFLDSPNYAPPDQLFSYIGMNPSLEISIKKNKLKISGEKKRECHVSKLFSVLKREWKRFEIKEKAYKGLTGGIFGYWGYETAELCEKVGFRKKIKSGIPPLYLGFFRELIVYDHKKRIYSLVSHPKTNSKRSEKEALKKIEILKKYFVSNVKKKKNNFKLKNFSPEISKKQFENMVLKAKDYIESGDIYQANLSQKFFFDFNGDSLKLYDKLRKINPSPFSCFFKIKGLEIISSSPERLIKKEGRLCETRPIAGTCPLYGNKKSSGFRKKLLKNEKERAEHLMLVDLERNDLGRVCDYRSVKVKEFMVLEKYSHVVHIVSKIVGILRKNKDVFDLIKAMFPGGTITGCPKVRCMEIIDELEPSERGLYTGSIGYIDFKGDIDLNIIIRTIVLNKNKGHLQVGAGIVYDSSPAREYEETLHKGEALLKALMEADLEK